MWNFLYLYCLKREKKGPANGENVQFRARSKVSNVIWSESYSENKCITKWTLDCLLDGGLSILLVSSGDENHIKEALYLGTPKIYEEQSASDFRGRNHTIIIVIIFAADFFF